MRQSLRRDLAIQRVQQGSVMRNIRVTEKEIDNFMATDEGLAMTQPQYPCVQALLPVTRAILPSKSAKASLCRACFAGILGGTSFSEEAVATEYQFQWRRSGLAED